MSITLGGLVFHPVEAATTEIGTTKGGWVYASQRPCYEAKTPAFYTLKTPLSTSDVTAAMGQPSDENDTTPMETLTSYDLMELAETVMRGKAFSDATADLNGAWELRALTHAEWLAARNQGVVELPSGLTERLADAPASNHRGAMMDGRPRPNEVLGPAASQMAAIAVHPRNEAVTAVASVPSDRPLPGVVGRLALVPIRGGPAKRVPSTTDVWRNIRSEALWTTVLGVVPSFLIPVLRGMGDYATEGWLNLLFGGLCAGFFTGAIWRPRRPVLRYEDVDGGSTNVSQ